MLSAGASSNSAWAAARLDLGKIFGFSDSEPRQACGLNLHHLQHVAACDAALSVALGKPDMSVVECLKDLLRPDRGVVGEVDLNREAPSFVHGSEYGRESIPGSDTAARLLAQ